MEALCLSAEELLIVENLITVFYESTGIPCKLVDCDGNEVLLSNRKVAFCVHFNKVDGEKDVCSKFHHSSGKQSDMIGETYISFCPSGLVHFTAGIHCDGQYRGAIVAGPVLFDIPDMYLLRKTLQDRKIDVSDMAFLEMYYNQVRVVDVEKGRRIRELLDVLIKEVDERLKGVNPTSGDHLASDDTEEAVPHETMDMNQSAYLEVKLKTDEKYPMDLEKELIHNIKFKNIVGVRKTINEILGYIYLRSELNHKEILVHVLELIVLMTRAAVDSGEDFNDMTEIISEYIESISRHNENEDSFEIVNTYLERFMNGVFKESGSKNNEKVVVQKITSYIQNNYNTGLTLEEVAGYAGMNVTYLSRFFKKHLGMNFSDYVNTIRVEFSKEYLENDRYSIIDVALMMGFTDQSYYSKVFKKYTGITPGKYRKLVKQVQDE